MGKTTRRNAVKKGRRKNARPAAGASMAGVHPVIVQADIPAAQRARRTFEVVKVPNPFGEVTQDGEIRQHSAVKVRKGWRALKASTGVCNDTYRVLEWLEDQMEMAEGGMVRCALDFSGGGGCPSTHVPCSMRATDARSEVDWALGFVSALERRVITLMMGTGLTFAAAGGAIWPQLNADVSARKASTVLKLAAVRLLAQCGARVLGFR